MFMMQVLTKKKKMMQVGFTGFIVIILIMFIRVPFKSRTFEFYFLDFTTVKDS